MENSTQINKDKTIKKELNKDSIKYPSINHETSIGSIDRYEQNIKQIKKNIEYDSLIYNYDKSVIDEIVNVMAEVMTVNVPYYTIEKKQYPAELVKHRFFEIDYRKMDAFLLDFAMRNEKIHNTKAYMITSLFNIPATADTTLSNMVRNDLYG